MNQKSQLEPLVLLEDEPVAGFKEDKLGVEPFARVVAGVAVGTNGPFTIGVFANWGEGKTSLLKQAKSLVDEYNPEIVTVWFNAWQYEKEDHPIVPLVASIVRAVDQKLASSAGLSEKLKDALSSASRALRAIAYGFSAKTKVAVPGFAEIEAGFVAKEMIDRYDKLTSAGDPLLDRTLYYNAFETLERIVAEQPAGETGIKIVVFVDDLDRCLPPNALKLLESIKLVLAQRGFVFALAVDRRVLESFLTTRYKNEYGVADYETCGTQYLDKIVQLPLPVPPHRARFRGYIEKLLGGPVFQHPSNTVVREAVSQLADVLAAGSNHNPRSLVRFLNNLIVDRQIWSYLLPQSEDNGDHTEANRLGLCAVCRILRQHLGDSLYSWLARSNDVCEQLASDALEKEPRKGKELPATLAERSTEELTMRLDQLSFLRDLLLNTDSGKSWLTNHKARRAVDEFLVQQREEEPQDERQITEDRALLNDDPAHRRRAITILAKKWPDETTRKLLEDRSAQDEDAYVRYVAMQFLTEKWSNETTRKLIEDRAIHDEKADSRSTAIQALGQHWPDEATRKLLEERAVHDEDGNARSTAIQALTEHWQDETTRKLLEDHAIRDENVYARRVAIQALAEHWPDETTRKLFEERAIHDENGHLRSDAFQALVEHWPDESTRKILEDYAINDENEDLRSNAIKALSVLWPSETTRKLLEDRAVQDEIGCVRSDAIQALIKHWPDETTRKILENHAIQDVHEYVRNVAFSALAEHWLDESTRKLLEDHAIFDGIAASVFGKLHSEFGQIVFKYGMDGWNPLLDPTLPISHEHINWAAEKAGVPADKIDETVRSLSEHMGWDITKGSGRTK